MLQSTVNSVKSALKRARITVRRRLPPDGEREPAPVPGSPAEQAVVAKLSRAYQSGDIEMLIAVLTADARLAMPPLPLEYQGRNAVARFFSTVGFRQGRRYDLVPTRANGQLAFGVYLRAPAGGIRHATGLDVLTLAGDRISAITHFDTSVLTSFGLPRSLPSR
jgi:SnoaL-like domain